MCPKNIIKKIPIVIMSTNPNIVTGFKNNPIPTIPAPSAPIAPVASITQEIPRQITIPDTNIDNIITIFGQEIQKKYFYIFLFIAICVAGYYLWKWYNDESIDNDEEDVEIPQYDTSQNNQNMEALMAQQLMAQKMAEELKKSNQ